MNSGENKMPTRCNRWFSLQILLLAQHVSGTTMPIFRGSRVLYKWLLPVVFGALVFKLSVWCGDEGYVSGLRAAAAAARKPDIVGISFPHINDDARSKPHQMNPDVLECKNHFYKHSIYMRGMQNTHRIWTGILKGTHSLEELKMQLWRIILK